MIKKLKFNGRITHKGTFCQCTRKIYRGNSLVNTTTERLDNTEYKALLYALTIEDSKYCKIKIDKNDTVVGYVITNIVQVDGSSKHEYTFDKFNIAAMS